MKESTLIEMQKKVESSQRITQYLFSEVERLKELSIGSLEVIKLMPDYDEALEKLKQNHLDNIQEERENKDGE
jgi:hypothetical protein